VGVKNNPQHNDQSHSSMDIRVYTTYVNTEDYDPYAEMVKERSPYLFCDVCMHYPIEPVHGHFMCPSCRNVTKCCEGAPMVVDSVGGQI
jgi:hypothetical protein